MTYGYARVSHKDQNLERQLIELRKYISEDRYIICDKATGGNFDRRGYNSLVGTPETAPILHEGDLLIIMSLDRLGRNYDEIRKQWRKITDELKVDIKVLDLPLLDTSNSQGNLEKKFIRDLVFQVLSYSAEKERENIKSRQRQGIDAMPVVDGKRVSPKTGRPTGRPALTFPKDWDMVYQEWKNQKITAKVAMEQLHLKRTSFYKLVKLYEEKEP